MDKILVSIWCITYNHELYIRDAIEGFLAQKTNFEYEIIIHDDASTDKTTEIIKEYKQKYPDLITAIYEKENQFSLNQPSIKWIQDIEAKSCHGKYIAVCEGDDYWIDVQKLQLQVDYLETHPECIMSVHDTIDFDCRNFTLKSRSLYSTDCIIPPEDIITQRALIPTASTVYRREALKMDEFFLNVGVGDYPTLLYCLPKGTIYYFSRIMAVYRRGQEGSWRDSMREIKFYLSHHMRVTDFLYNYNEYTQRKYEKFIINKIQCHINEVMFRCEEDYFEDLYKICLSDNENLNRKFQLFFSKIGRLKEQISDIEYLDKTVYEFAVRHPRIFIMGAGRYAGIMAHQLEHHKISFEGFVVSHNRTSQKYYLKKPVWELGEISLELSNAGIIVGINPVCWSEIVDALEDAGAFEYICPFLFG